MFVYDDFTAKKTYTAQQLLEGKADQPFKWGYPAKSVKSFEDIGLDAGMLSLDYYEKKWGKPDVYDKDNEDPTTPNLYYYFKSKPDGIAPYEAISLPHVYVFTKNKTNISISASTKDATSGSERFQIGKLKLLNSSKADYEKVLGASSDYYDSPETKTAFFKWAYLVGDAPNRTAISMYAVFKNSRCVKVNIDLAKEVQSGARKSPLASLGKGSVKTRNKQDTIFLQGSFKSVDAEQIEKGLASPFFGSGEPPRKAKSLEDIGLDPAYLKSDALIKLWGKPSRDLSGQGTAPEARNDEMYVYYLGKVPESDKLEDWSLESNITVFGESGSVYSIMAMSMGEPKTDWHLFGKLQLIGGTLEDYKQRLGEPAPGSDEDTGTMRWSVLCGKSPKRTAVSIDAIFVNGLSSMVNISFAYEAPKENSAPGVESK